MRPRLVLVFALAAASWAAAQRVSFDVASIKPSPDIATIAANHIAPHIGTRIDAAHVDIGFASLRDLIATAYSVKPYQVKGPDWLATERFDIQATLPQGATAAQLPELLQSLLADRFKLQVHRDDQAQSVYAMTVSPSGLKAKPSPTDAPAAAADAKDDKSTTSIDTADGPMKIRTARSGASTTVFASSAKTGMMTTTMSDGQMHLNAEKMSMDQLALSITPMLDLPVINQTNLPGNYQISLNLSLDDLRAAASKALGPGAMPNMMGGDAANPNVASTPAGGSIFSSIDALGLKLTKRNLPVGHVVIDSIEKTPTPN
ncbi:MAG TPA: TIGR03435 family protein [Terriglobales bacterium]|nr:TIGR03435 family protein [Terriglobales bacterium]